MTKQEKLDLVSRAYTTKQKNGEDISIIDTDVIKDDSMRGAIQNIQQALNVDFDQSYEIMHDACYILSEKTLAGTDRDSLTSEDLDFMADADSNANVYIGVQLSYLNIQNEDEISNLMKDEAITSTAQACSIWYTQKVAEACEALKDYILQ